MRRGRHQAAGIYDEVRKMAESREELEARIAKAKSALDITDRDERKAAEHVATLRRIAATKGVPRSERRKAAKDADRIERTIAKDVAAIRAPANQLLSILQAELEELDQ
jgi:hypothetical protein